MDDLVMFLQARLDEDEAIARAAMSDATHRGYDGDDGIWEAGGTFGPVVVAGVGIKIYDEGGHTEAQARHIARHDPARGLREVEAKRRSVAEHEPDQDSKWAHCSTCFDEEDFSEDSKGNRIYHDRSATAFPCPTLRQLAAIWSEHPDYRAEWAPAE